MLTKTFEGKRQNMRSLFCLINCSLKVECIHFTVLYTSFSLQKKYACVFSPFFPYEFVVHKIMTYYIRVVFLVRL